MARSTTHTYDPATGTWSTTSADDKGSTSNDSSSSKSSGESNLTSSNSDSKSSTGSVEKKYNNIEVNTLVGTLNFICTKETIKLKAGDTVNINGIGKYLSGKYYVKEVVRQISNNGYSHSAVLIKTDFGKSLKMSATEEKKEETKVVSSPAPQQNAQRTYTVKKGDCLWKIAKQYYGNGAKWGTIYDANTGKIANPNLIYPGQVFVIP